ncbi:antibiotic biosynthesis monooxygenase [Sphingobacterium sp. JB170]|uniref:antibiotic biosynthesis monooxygenase family protein n=1 Tax=Sphingobacterium sp. JB170 TaxID=1434842 RepID=UPI00097E894A|nr:antibiotic biosynthesis monooxygenase [Sphingobacterium sp. JB170]SJN49866.1 Antibiotic biosynthesis monooxygenase [Sphingobacterium sp. JB170]
MILKVAILNVKPEKASTFERDFQTTGQYISSIEGYIRHTLNKCTEVTNQYILLVEWTTVEVVYSELSELLLGFGLRGCKPR